MARLGMETAEPASFLLIRFALAAAVLLGIIWLVPSSTTKAIDWRQVAHSAIAGILLQAVYLGGVFAGVNLGIGAGLSSLIVGVQPILTVLLAALWLSEKLSYQKILGCVLGFVGVCLVTAQWSQVDGALSLHGLAFCVAALFGITFGTIYQKKFCHSLDLHINMATQYIAASVFLLPMALWWESFNITWTLRLVLVLAWLVLGLSIGAVFLLMWLIRVGEAGRVSSLFFLVPPVVAIEAWFLFAEPLNASVVAGTVLCIVGVAIVAKPAPRKPA